MIRFEVRAVCALLAGGLAAAVAGGAGKGDAQKGKAVFAQCALCHVEKKIGPSLAGLFKKTKMADGKRPTEPNVRARIDEGGGGMPAYKDMLGDDDKDNLIAYLKAL